VRAHEIKILRVDLGSDEARSVIGSAEAELDRRYGPGTNREFLDPLSFAPPRGSFLICRLDGRLVGGVGLRGIADRVGEVKRLWVDDADRRMGVGAALMDAIELEGQALEMGLIVLETGPLQPEAASLYAARGWELVDQLPVHVSDYPHALRFLKYYDDSLRS
jgi:GNAT superfamily N-acetyltransferase